MYVETVRSALRLARNRTNNQINIILKRAEDYLRAKVPYRPGGKSPDGMDCSGLITNCVPKLLPDGAEKQFEHLKPWIFTAPDIRYLEAGDFIFFAKKSDQQTVSHIGVVHQTVGDGAWIIHSSEALRGVSRDKFDITRNVFRTDYACVGVAKTALFLFRCFLRDEVNKEIDNAYRISF